MSFLQGKNSCRQPKYALISSIDIMEHLVVYQTVTKADVDIVTELHHQSGSHMNVFAYTQKKMLY